MFSRTNPPRSTAANSFRFRSYVERPILHYFGANKSFGIRSYREGPRNPFRMRSYKNTGGGGTPTLSRLPRAHLAKGCKNSETATFTFRINTCKSVSKQRTLTPLRITTYKKPGEGGVCLFRVSSVQPPVSSLQNHMRHVAPLSPVASVDCAYFLSPRGCTHYALQIFCKTPGVGVCPFRLTVAPAPDLYHPAHLELDSVYRMRFHKLPLQIGNALGALS